MKYIKLFENFNKDISEILLECEDILIPLKDDYMNIKFSQPVAGNSNHVSSEYISCKIGNFDDLQVPFCLEIYKDNLKHLFSYLKEMGFTFINDESYTDTGFDGGSESDEESVFWDNIDTSYVLKYISFERKRNKTL